MESFNYKNYYVVVEKRSKNKNSYIRLKDDGTLYITTPYHVNVDNLYPFIDKFINKLENKYDIDKITKNKNLDNIYYLGNLLPVKTQKTNGKEYAFMDNDILYLFLKDPEDLLSKQNIIKKFLVDAAKKVLVERFNQILENYQHIDFVPKLKIRAMKSKYGACYYKRNEIVLSSMLMHYDYECIDYVIVHELAHFTMPNHSKKFYNLVQMYLPNYKQAENKLKNLKSIE